MGLLSSLLRLGVLTFASSLLPAGAGIAMLPGSRAAAIILLPNAQRFARPSTRRARLHQWVILYPIQVARSPATRTARLQMDWAPSDAPTATSGILVLRALVAKARRTGRLIHQLVAASWEPESSVVPSASKSAEMPSVLRASFPSRTMLRRTHATRVA